MTLHFIVHRQFSDRDRWHGWTFQENVVCLWMGKRGPNCSSLQTGQGWAAHHKPTQKLELREGRCYLVSFCVCFFACSFGCIRLQATVHINYMFSLFLSRYMLSVYRKNSLLVWIFGHEIFILCNRYNFGGWKGQNGFLCFVFFFLKLQQLLNLIPQNNLLVSRTKTHSH